MYKKEKGGKEDESYQKVCRGSSSGSTHPDVTAGSTCGNGAGGRWCGSDGPAGTLERVNVQRYER